MLDCLTLAWMPASQLDHLIDSQVRHLCLHTPITSASLPSFEKRGTNLSWPFFGSFFGKKEGSSSFGGSDVVTVGAVGERPFFFFAPPLHCA